MPMHDWIHKYPGVRALLQQPDDDLLDSPGEEERALPEMPEPAPCASLPPAREPAQCDDQWRCEISLERWDPGMCLVVWRRRQRPHHWRVPRVLPSGVVAVYHALLQVLV